MSDDILRLQEHLHHLMEVAEAQTPCEQLAAVATMVLEAGEGEQAHLGTGMAFLGVLGAVREGSRVLGGMQEHGCNPLLVAGVAERTDRLRAAALAWWRGAADGVRRREVAIAGEATDEYEAIVASLEAAPATEERLGDLQRVRDLVDPVMYLLADDPAFAEIVAEVRALDSRAQAALGRALAALPFETLRQHEVQVRHLGIPPSAWWHYLVRFRP